MAENKNWLIEDVIPLYFDKAAFREPRQKLYRVYTPRGRYYYTFDESTKEIKLYIGVTTMISKTLPTPDQLIDWMIEQGKEGRYIEANIRAAYGTAMHRICGDYAINREYDLSKVAEVAEQEYNKLRPVEQMKVNLFYWQEDLVRDLFAWGQFVKDYNYEPIAVEVMLAHPDGYAGALDHLGYMTIQEKIDPDKKATASNLTSRRIIATIDQKSGRKGFYESHEVQLASYRKLVENEWPDIIVEKVYNWSPKEWRTTPGYNLKDQSDSVDALKFQNLVQLAKIELMKPPGSMLKFGGVLKYGEEFNFEEVAKEVDIIEYLREYHMNKLEAKAVPVPPPTIIPEPAPAPENFTPSPAQPEDEFEV